MKQIESSGRSGHGHWLRHAFTLCKALVSSGLILLVLTRIDFSHFLMQWHDLGVFTALSGLTLLALEVTVIAGLRLKLVLASLDVPRRLRETWQVALCGFFFEVVTIGFVGGDVMRLWLLRRLEVPLRKAAAAVLIDRCLGFAGLLLLVLFGLQRLLSQIDGIDRRVVLAIVLGLILTGCTGFIALFLLPERWHRTPMLGDMAGAITKTVRDGVVAARFALVLVLAVTTQLLNVTVFALVGHALGLPLGIGDWLMVVPMVLLFSMIPVSAGGWGVREGAMIIALQGFGVPAEQAVVPSIVFGLGILLVTLPGGVVWLARRKTSRRLTTL